MVDWETAYFVYVYVISINKGKKVMLLHVVEGISLKPQEMNLKLKESTSGNGKQQ